MTISVAMCTYNGGRYLQQQLSSIALQTLPPDELIICDDGSSDSTEEVVEHFRGSASFPVSFHRNEHNLGSTRNFEQAVGLCRGDIIALCDQDDVWSAEKLALMGGVLDENPRIAGLFSNASLMDGQGTPQTGNLWERFGFTSMRQDRFNRQTAFDQLLQRDTVTGATLLFRSSYLPLLVPFPTEWVHDGWIALLLAALAEIKPLPARPMAYRIHAQQQVGAKQTPLSDHLRTEKQAASLFHLTQVARFRLLLERLEQIASMQDGSTVIDPALMGKVKRKIEFFETRALLLERPPLKRLREATRILSEYRLYEKGFLSFFRDLTH
jgi:glycosyltransferase involved in cell wall biosynthesis